MPNKKDNLTDVVEELSKPKPTPPASTPVSTPKPQPGPGQVVNSNGDIVTLGQDSEGELVSVLKKNSLELFSVIASSIERAFKGIFEKNQKNKEK